MKMNAAPLSPNAPARARRRMHFGVAGGALVVGLLLTAWGVQAVQQSIEAKARYDFDQYVNRLANEVQSRFER